MLGRVYFKSLSKTIVIYSYFFFFAVRCTNSLMGRITEAMVQLRRRVTEVDVLILEDNNIPHLPSRAFGSVKINRLFIENNRIKTIDRNAFAGIEDFLTELYIKVSERMSFKQSFFSNLALTSHSMLFKGAKV